MKTPDQNSNPLEEKESLQSVIQVLKKTAEKFRSLDVDAKHALAQEDPSTYKQKLAEKAQILMDLPNQINGLIDNLEPEEKHKIRLSIESFAISAKEAIQLGHFALGVLLIPYGSKIGDKNELEELIVELEGK